MGESIGLPVGERIPDGGASQFQGYDENGLLRSLTGRLTGVHKVLCSAAEIACKGRQDLYLGHDGTNLVFLCTRSLEGSPGVSRTVGVVGLGVRSCVLVPLFVGLLFRVASFCVALVVFLVALWPFSRGSFVFCFTQLFVFLLLMFEVFWRRMSALRRFAARGYGGGRSHWHQCERSCRAV